MLKQKLIKQYFFMAIAALMPTLLSTIISWILVDHFPANIWFPIILILGGFLLSTCISLQHLKRMECSVGVKWIMFIFQPSTLLFVSLVAMIVIVISALATNGIHLDFGPKF